MGDENKTDKKNEKSCLRNFEEYDPHSVSWWWPILFLAAGCLIFYLIHLQDHVLPPVVTIQDSEKNPHLFSGERSRLFLRKLANIGQRVVGTDENEIMTPLLFEEEINDIKTNALSIQSIQFDVQHDSGIYQLDEDFSYTNIYKNINNVVVLLEGSEGKHSILFNCHYDSVPTSRGASDNGISCAAMIELLRVLSISPTRLKHNIVFLFNGAEETGLHGSHMFLSHKWAEKCRIVLNLESAGTGGRVVLFQSGPENPWIFNYYARLAPYPHTQVVGEELFQNNFIPSDTDFRIFRDFGNMPGLDFAFLRNAYLYHTKYDIEEYIPPGSHQHVGNIILAVIKELGNAPEFDDLEGNADGQMVYYDYLGWFLVYYSYEAFIAINIISALVGVLSVIIFIGRLMDWSWLPQYKEKSIENNELSTIDVPFERKNITNENTNEHKIDKEKNTFDEKKNTINEEENIIDENENKEENVISVDTIDDKEKNILTVGVVTFVDTSNHNENSVNSIHGLSKGGALCEFGIAVCARLAAMLATFGVGAAVAAIVDAAAVLAMPWYTHVWLIFPLYWCPCLVIYALIPWLVDMWREKKRKMSLSIVAQMNLVVSQIPWIIIIFVMTCMGIRSSVIFMLPVMSTAVANLIIHLTPLYKKAHIWVWFYLIVNVFSFLFIMYFSMLVYMLFIPIMGRSGPINSDLYIGIVTVLLTLYVSSFIIPLMTLVRKQARTMIFLVVFTVVMIIISLTTTAGHPYRNGPNNPVPQRYWIMHSNRIFYDQAGKITESKNGYFIMNWDRNSPKTLPHEGLKMESLKKDCEEKFYCGLPLYTIRIGLIGDKGTWIPASEPYLPNETKLILGTRCTEDPTILSNNCTMDFTLKGPDRMTFTFSPRPGAKLLEWSLKSEIQSAGEWKGQPTYYLHIVQGHIIDDFKLTLTFEVTPQQKASDPFLDVGLAGNHAHHDDDMTEDFKKFLNFLPDYTTVSGWISAFRGYVF